MGGTAATAAAIAIAGSALASNEVAAVAVASIVASMSIGNAFGLNARRECCNICEYFKCRGGIATCGSKEINGGLAGIRDPILA